MNKDDEYRENAAECERMARITRDNTDKRTWLDMAQHWQGLIGIPPGGSPAARGLKVYKSRGQGHGGLIRRASRTVSHSTPS
jgi:hypothetical protein